DTGALIDRGKLTVKIAGISFSAGNFSLRGGNLTHGLRKGSHIRQDDQDVHMLFKCKVFGYGKGYLRCDQTLDNRIVCQVQEHGHMVCNSAFFKCMSEEISHVVLDT